MFFAEHDLGSMARYVYDASLLAYFFLPLRMIQRLTEIRINEIYNILPHLSYPSARNDPTTDGNSTLIRWVTGIWIIELSSLLPHLTYPSTLKWSDGWREFGFDLMADGYLDNQILNPLSLLILFFHLKWSDGCEDSWRRSMIKDGCRTKTCEWFNSSPKLRNFICALLVSQPQSPIFDSIRVDGPD